MLRRVALLAMLVAVAGLSAVALSAPATATPVTSSNITSPTDGFHYLKTDANPATNVLVQGTTNGDTGNVELRCYFRPGYWSDTVVIAAVGPDGKFAAQYSTNNIWGACVLRAVPEGWPAASSVTAFTGPRVTEEEIVSRTITAGPNAGKVDDYYVSLMSAKAFNDYKSATSGGLNTSRLQYADGSSSNQLWAKVAGLYENEPGSGRSFLQVDGHDAYGPRSATVAWNTGTESSADNPGFPELTFSARRDPITGVTTIHETDPIVVCPGDTPFPATPASCTKFNRAGVRLDRKIITDDSGLQTHITDVWRSTDGKAHTVSAHYQQQVDGLDWTTGTPSPVQVGLKLPWISSSYAPFSSDAVYAGPSKSPTTLYVHDNNLAADGDKNYLRGAISLDYAPNTVHRVDNERFTLRHGSIRVPAGGSRLVRQDFVIGTTQSVVNAKAAANARRINPWRPDSLIRAKSASSYTGNHIYNARGTHQTVGTGARRGASATFSVKVQNDGTQPDSFTVKGPGNPAGLNLHYFAGTKDITAAVQNGSYLLKNLAPGAARTIRLVVTVKGSAALGAVRSWLVTSTSIHDTTRKDAVKARVRVVTG